MSRLDSLRGRLTGAPPVPEETEDTLVTITNVLHAPQDGYVQFLGAPAAGTTSATYGFRVEGWVNERFSTVEVVDEFIVHRAVRPGPPPPAPGGAKAKRGRAIAPAGSALFRGHVNAVALPPTFTLYVRAVSPTGECVPIANVEGRRRALPHDEDGGLQPLLITTVGRSGSTLFMRVLGQHPEIVVEPSFPYEFAAAQYWAQALIALSERTEGEIHPRTLPSAGTFHKIGDRAGREHVERVARMCRAHVRASYDDVRERGQKPAATFFAEKQTAGPAQWVLRDLFPGAREVFLVRDFRDVVSSILAFDSKRGYPGFGRRPNELLRDYLLRLGTTADQLVAAWRQRRDTALLVRYEDLVRDPAPVLRAVLEHVGVSASADMVGELASAAAARDSHAEAHATTDEPARSIRRFATDLDPDVADLCSERYSGFLGEFGYA